MCFFFQGKFPVLSHESNLELFLCVSCLGLCWWSTLPLSVCPGSIHGRQPTSVELRHFFFFSVTNFLLQNLVLSHVSNSVSSFCAFTAVWPSNSHALVFTVLLSYHPHITSQRPNPISVFLFSFSFNFPQNASVYRKVK